VQQAKSFVSQQRGPKLDQPAPSVPHEKEASVHLEQQKAGDKPLSIHARVGDNYDARDVLIVRKKHKEDGANRGYHPHRGDCYDSGEDQSPSPKPLGPHVFSQDICNAPFWAWFRQPANITKYSGETNPKLWLDDYRLTYQLGSANDDRFIIRNLPLFLVTQRELGWSTFRPVASTTRLTS
jgi:hypothetical protein